ITRLPYSMTSPRLRRSTRVPKPVQRQTAADPVIKKPARSTIIKVAPAAKSVHATTAAAAVLTTGRTRKTIVPKQQQPEQKKPPATRTIHPRMTTVAGKAYLKSPSRRGPTMPNPVAPADKSVHATPAAAAVPVPTTGRARKTIAPKQQPQEQKKVQPPTTPADRHRVTTVPGKVDPNSPSRRGPSMPNPSYRLTPPVKPKKPAFDSDTGCVVNVSLGELREVCKANFVYPNRKVIQLNVEKNKV
ncbi:hypothetical protein PFISCL1PPCAC_20730, partial [Pristionchus fissidentatus]